MNNHTKNCKIIFFEIIRSVSTNEIIFILIRIYVRISKSHRWEPGLNVDSLTFILSFLNKLFVKTLLSYCLFDKVM